VIDPSFEPESVLKRPAAGWRVEGRLLTHAHFDHISGTTALRRALGEHIPVRAASAGPCPYGARTAGPACLASLFRGETANAARTRQKLALVGKNRGAAYPGHSPRSCRLFYAPGAGLVFCGDLIFYRSVGRTDLPEASSAQLAALHPDSDYTLPLDTRLAARARAQKPASGRGSRESYVYPITDDRAFALVGRLLGISGSIARTGLPGSRG